MLNLKTEIIKNNISLSEIIKKFNEEYGQSLSKTALSLFLNKGIEPKKIEDIQEKIETILKKLINKEDVVKKSVLLKNEAMKHFKLSIDPFMPVYTCQKDIIMLQAHYDALENMRLTAELGLMTAITGQVGSGKSTVRIKFKSNLKNSDRFILVQPKTQEINSVTSREILESILRKLSEEKPKRNLESLSQQVYEALVNLKNQGKRLVLLIEEAQDLHTHTLKRLKRLWEMRDEEDETAPLIAIILIGQDDFEYKLYGSQNMYLREVASRITHVQLRAINNELYDYIAYKLKRADANIEKIITRDAVDALSDIYTKKDLNGRKEYIAYPNDINNKMKELMNLAALSGEEIITKEFVESTNL